MPAKHSRRWTRADVLALMDANPLQTPRYEVVRGELLVTPSPTWLHQKAVLELARRLAAYCEETGIGVLSPGSERGDRGPKRELYHETVPVYWLVDVHRRHVEQWIGGRDGSTVERERLSWRP